MTGVTGTVTLSTNSSNWSLAVTREVSWRQEYTPGNNYSDIVITARIVRAATPDDPLGGGWYPAADGSIKVNGTAAISWTSYGVNAAWTNPGDVGWESTGTVRVEHTKSVDITIDISNVYWVNTSYNSLSFSLAAQSKTVTLDAVEALGTARIGNVTYDIYIGGSGKYERYRAYVGAADGSQWLPVS